MYSVTDRRTDRQTDNIIMSVADNHTMCSMIGYDQNDK